MWFSSAPSLLAKCTHLNTQVCLHQTQSTPEDVCICTAEVVSFQFGPSLILKENPLFIIMYIHLSKIMYLHSGRNKLRHKICSVDFFFNHFYVMQKIKPRTLHKLGKALLHRAICSAIKHMTSHPLFSFLWKKDTERRDFKAKEARG